jgi:hypothetical protein
MHDSSNKAATFPCAVNTVASKTIDAADDTKMAQATGDQAEDLDLSASAKDSLAQSFVMRRLAPALARIEIHSPGSCAWR